MTQIVTITDDYDVAVGDGGSKTENPTTTLVIGIFISNIGRGALRFPLTDAPGGTPILVELIVQVLTASSSANATQIRPYNTDGQTDPSGDTGATGYSRCNTGSSMGTVPSNSTGVKTIDITNGAASLIASAKSAVGRFTVALKSANEASANFSPFYAFKNYSSAHTNPQLRLTYADAEVDLLRAHPRMMFGARRSR